MSGICHIISNGEILNIDKIDCPLFQAVLYGDRTLCNKFSKRLSCSVKHLPLRLQFSYEYSTQKAIEKGVVKDPTLVLDGKIFIEGLIQSEEITTKFQDFIMKPSQNEVETLR